MFERIRNIELVAGAVLLAFFILLTPGICFAAEEDPDDPGRVKKTNDPTGDTEAATWIGIPESNTAKVKFLKDNNGKIIEFRKRAKQKVYAYDTFQGCTTDGEYAYHVLYDRVKNRDKIIKIKLEDLSVVKVSKVLDLHHGNDMAYDSKKKRLVVVHETGALKKLSIVDPETLKIVKDIKVKIPSSLPGASKSFVSGIKGFTGIGYDDQENNFVLSIKKARHYIVLSSSFKPMRIIKVPKLPEYMPQGMDVKSGFILRSYSAANKKLNTNIVNIFDLNGNYIKTLKLGKGYEVESIYFVGSRMYAGTYRSYYKVKYKKVKKRVLVKVKKFTGKYKANGKKIYKYKYKYKKKKVKVKYFALQRDNNIIRIKNY